MKKNRQQKKGWLEEVEQSYRDLTPDQNPKVSGYDSNKYFKESMRHFKITALEGGRVYKDNFDK